MRTFRPSSIRSAVIAGCFLAGLLVSTAIHADEVGIEVNEPSWIGKTLEHQMGKRVKLKLRSGQELEGTVTKVGAHAVHVAQLAGMDFYDAAVRLDDVSAVVVKARNK
jgi:uncharacterized protein (DUF1697 family)